MMRNGATCSSRLCLDRVLTFHTDSAPEGYDSRRSSAYWGMCDISTSKTSLPLCPIAESLLRSPGQPGNTIGNFNNPRKRDVAPSTFRRKELHVAIDPVTDRPCSMLHAWLLLAANPNHIEYLVNSNYACHLFDHSRIGIIADYSAHR